MRRYLATAIAAGLMAALASCAPAASSQAQPSASGSGLPGPGTLPSTAASAGAVPSFETGPTGTPIGDWSLTLTGGPAAGTYSGRDEMTCVTGAGLPTSVAANPVGSPPIGHIAMVTGSGADDKILVSAGGIEGGGAYQTSSTAETLDGPTVTNGILHLKMSGTQVLSDETRTLLLEATCPLFPAETDG
ncbi:MAG TPA: hypothetical protein VL687_05235 [Methylomirabilota bacterium]|jgi:hypothetical protein|nr:hypothetical protein [Methylomirabilota bacterium]